MTPPISISFGARLSALAAARGSAPAVTLVGTDGVERSLSYPELDRLSNRMARLLLERGAGPGRFVVVLLPNSLEHYVASFGAWKAGACVLPLSAAMPPRELAPLIELADPAAIVVKAEPPGWSADDRRLVRLSVDALGAFPDAPVEDRIPRPGKAIASGGSTGRPKIIVDPAPWARVPGGFVESIGQHLGMRSDQTQLIPGPLYHNLGFNWGSLGLFEGHQLIVLERFDPVRMLDAIERHRIGFMIIVPTMMGRVAALERARQADWSSIVGVAHTAAPCPPSVKRAWIDFVGPERLHEAFGATEGVGITMIRGDEWLERPGSVGRPFLSDLRILDPEGRPLPPGRVGEIYMRSRFGTGQPYHYLGGTAARATPDGFESVGDLGWVDEAGYLFPADRRTDLIITGGANVYPAEVEAAILEHDAVRDVAVIGLPDDDLGRRVHAVVELVPGRSLPAREELDRHCRERLAPYKRPRSYEFTDRLPRDESGKLRRSSLVADRS
jgi:bile acid-coenzyme A ligase